MFDVVKIKGAWGLGYNFALGAGVALLLAVLLSEGLGWAADRLGLADHDSTDAPGQHSGLTIHTDHLTGCQYLSGGGSMTPRLSKDGRPICT